MNYEGNHPVGQWNFFNGANGRPITLIDAIGDEDPELLLHVLEEGADVNEDLGEGWTALHEAFDYAIDGMIQQEWEAPDPKVMAMIKILMDNGAELLKRNDSNKTPLDALITYSASEEGFNEKKAFFRAIIPNIDNLVQYKRAD